MKSREHHRFPYAIWVGGLLLHGAGEEEKVVRLVYSNTALSTQASLFQDTCHQCQISKHWYLGWTTTLNEHKDPDTCLKERKSIKAILGEFALLCPCDMRSR